MEQALKELWQQFGTGEKKRMIPIHSAHSTLSTEMCKTVIKAHRLTGDDCSSKIGTKRAGINCDPVDHLMNFGNDVLSEQDIRQAEKYLVGVWAGIRSNTTAETFDQLRV